MQETLLLVGDCRPLDGQSPVRAVGGQCCQLGLLCGGDTEMPACLDRDPVAHVSALAVSGQPLGGIVGTLDLVVVSVDADQGARVYQIVVVTNASGLGPPPGAGDPGVVNRHGVVDLNGPAVGVRVVGGVVVGVPLALGHRAVVVLGDGLERLIRQD